MKLFSRVRQLWRIFLDAYQRDFDTEALNRRVYEIDRSARWE